MGIWMRSGWMAGLVVVTGLAGGVFGANWGNWRGPTGNGVAEDGNPPVKWSAGKNVKWKVKIPGKGNSSPVVWGDKVFLLTAEETNRKAAMGDVAGDEIFVQEEPRRRRRGGRRGFRRPKPTNVYQFSLVCVSRKSGKILWKKTAVEAVPHESGHSTNTQASASPVTDGKHVYANFGSRGVFCFDMDGKVKWKRDLGDMRTRASFGEGASPALYGNTLVVPWDHEGESFIAALDATTGKTIWKKERDEPTTWATPLIAKHDGKMQVVTNGTRRVRSYDLKTGKLLWACGGQATNPIASPVVMGDVVYCMTGYRGYAVYAVRLGSKGDITGKDKEVWKRTDAGPYIASPTLYQGRLYYTKSRDGVLVCVDAKTGKTLYGPMRVEGIRSMYASLVAAQGRIYMTGRDGTTVVFAAGDEFKVLATNSLGEGVDASPAIVGDQMFVRTATTLYCLEKE